MRMPKWLLYSVLTVIFWGAWAVVSKEALGGISPMQNQLLFTVGLMPLMLVAALSKNVSSGTDKRRGAVYAAVTGILGGTGNIAFFEALGHGGKASTVTPVTGLYPLLTVGTALLVLKERLNRVQVAGIAMALAAIWLFSTT